MEEFLNKLFDKHSEGYGVYDRKQIIQEFTDNYCSKQLMQTAVIESVCDDCKRKNLYIKKQCYCGYCGDRLKK
tara:strand:- start:58 stop:276 length:219 start_codon:yes stop_codon:yes gene_type:complete